MLVYREDDREIDARLEWRALVRRVDALPPTPSHDDVTSILIDLGELEAAVADCLFPERDDDHPLAALLRAAALAAGRLFVASWRAPDEVPGTTAALGIALSRVQEHALPPHARRRVSEGYAYYALHPERYAAAADRFAAAAAPAAADCIAIRSIGTSLSAVVAAALDARGIPVRLWSVRPRGHPFDRTLRLEGGLRGALRAAPPEAHYLIIDEGPGLSGSSFACTAQALVDLGVPPSRICFFPSWDADGSTLRSDRARAVWGRHRRWTSSDADARTGIRGTFGGVRSTDWSAGSWRDAAYSRASEWPAVQPQHERVKHFLPETLEVLRFAGLGHYGEARRARAIALASGGFGPEPGPLRSGYLLLPWVAGRPYSRGGFDARLADFVPEYLAFIARSFRQDGPPVHHALYAMIETNLREADPSLHVPPLSRFTPALVDAAPIAVDGRMLAHEFIRTEAGVHKADGLDHATDHFFPGVQDPAWDLAGVEMEFSLDEAASAALASAVAVRTGDAGIAARLPFYRLAYAAFQVGYATLAGDSLGGTADGQRFARRRSEFLDRCRALTAP